MYNWHVFEPWMSTASSQLEASACAVFIARLCVGCTRRAAQKRVSRVTTKQVDKAAQCIVAVGTSKRSEAKRAPVPPESPRRHDRPSGRPGSGSRRR